MGQKSGPRSQKLKNNNNNNENEDFHHMGSFNGYRGNKNPLCNSDRKIEIRDDYWSGARRYVVIIAGRSGALAPTLKGPAGPQRGGSRARGNPSGSGGSPVMSAQAQYSGMRHGRREMRCTAYNSGYRGICWGDRADRRYLRWLGRFATTASDLSPTPVHQSESTLYFFFGQKTTSC